MELIYMHINMISFVMSALLCTHVFQATARQLERRTSDKIETSHPLILFLARVATIPIVMIGTHWQKTERPFLTTIIIGSVSAITLTLYWVPI